MVQRLTVVLAILAAVFVGVPGALAAGPRDIYKDLADNGRVDGTYTRAEMNAFLQSASVQGYGNPVIATPQPAGDVAGAVTDPVEAEPLSETATVGTLPFTGAELGLLGLVGAALLGGGVLLRLSTRKA
jgi:hypothetical protein